jgi:hypothetical protein
MKKKRKLYFGNKTSVMFAQMRALVCKYCYVTYSTFGREDYGVGRLGLGNRLVGYVAWIENR